MLNGSLFMMQVYDRVLASRSVPTLVALGAIVMALYLVQGALDLIRARLLVRVAERVDAEVGPEVFANVVRAPLRSSRSLLDPLQPLRDLEAMRSFLSGPGMAALFDLPWIPIYLAIDFILHPVLGWIAVAAALGLIGVTALMEVRAYGPTLAALQAMAVRSHLASAAQRGAEALTAMGMMSAVFDRWSKVHADYLRSQRTAADIGAGFTSTSRMLRFMLQSIVLGVAAYLAISEEISSGSIIAASILCTRALAPIDQVIGSWRNFVAARQGYGRLARLLEAPPAPRRLTLPKPATSLSIEGIFVGPPGDPVPIIRGISFALHAGDGLGIIGPSASGKSTLGRALVGLWPPMKGNVALDKAPLDQWDSEVLGRHVGYLPQDVQLFDGTVAENIARLKEDAPPEAIIDAAKQAGLHEHILALSDGYNTRVGQGGAHLSAGQRQRLGLARALFGNPFLVVLDEPNANLDADGEISVAQAIRSVRSRGGIAVVIAHRPSAIATVELLLVMRGGAAVALGPKEEVLAKITRSNQPTGPVEVRA